MQLLSLIHLGDQHGGNVKLGKFALSKASVVRLQATGGGEVPIARKQVSRPPDASCTVCTCTQVSPLPWAVGSAFVRLKFVTKARTSRLGAGAIESVAKLEALGATPVGGTPERTNAFFKSEAAKWKRIIEVADIKPE